MIILEAIKFKNCNRVWNPSTDDFERGKLGEQQDLLFD
jgi:hypothetical protein